MQRFWQPKRFCETEICLVPSFYLVVNTFKAMPQILWSLFQSLFLYTFPMNRHF